MGVIYWSIVFPLRRNPERSPVPLVLRSASYLELFIRDLVTDNCPPLHFEDVVGLVVGYVQFRDRFQVGQQRGTSRPITAHDDAARLDRAIRIVALRAPGALIQAGFLSGLFVPAPLSLVLIRPARERFKLWNKEVLVPALHGTGGDPVESRFGRLRLAWTVLRDGAGRLDSGKLEKDVCNVIRRVERRTGKPPSREDVLAEVAAPSATCREGDGSFFEGADGEMHLNVRRIAQALMRQLGRRLRPDRVHAAGTAPPDPSKEVEAEEERQLDSEIRRLLELVAVDDLDRHNLSLITGEEGIRSRRERARRLTEAGLEVTEGALRKREKNLARSALRSAPETIRSRLLELAKRLSA